MEKKFLLEEEDLRQIIREEVQSQLWQIRLHLLAISQATGAVPWQHIYKFSTDEAEFPYQVLFNYRDEIKAKTVDDGGTSIE